MKITIRDATHDDAEGIALLITQLGYPVHSEFVLRKLEELGELRSAFVLVAECERDILGVLSFNSEPAFHKEGRIGTMTALSIREDLRGQGIGRQLVLACEARAREQGCYRIAVASGMQRLDAHRFYLGLGYVEKTKRFVKDFDE
ncbi:MAG TPA: GNAT family N-acetyltransferase [Candidatus Kapabacteria bacterium]|nr:GNAT family N-acetyltransferase [Candidatus Kapabacteria bacterium]